MAHIFGGTEAQVRTVLIVSAVLLILAKLSGFYFAPLVWRIGPPPANGPGDPPDVGPRPRRSYRRVVETVPATV